LRWKEGVMTAGPIANVSGRIFISYRREETAYPAGWLYERLTDRFGGGRIFKDVDSINLGDDFVDVISRAVASCDVLLVLIGEGWSTIRDAQGKRRLDDRDDFVRLEIEAALTRQVRVIPVLVDGARMPRADELPESLEKLVRKQSLELSPSRFEFDTGRLMKVLDSTLAESRNNHQDASSETAAKGAAASTPPDAQTADRPRRRTARTWILTAVGAAVVVIVLVVAASLASTRDTPTASGGIEVDSTPVTSDGLRLTGLTAVTPNGSRAVGDTVTITYSLTNVSQQDIQLEDTFVGARNPDNARKDAENDNEQTVLAPGESVSAKGRVFLGSKGTWTIWPCYTFASGDLCPDKWQAFSLIAE
jgi:hypothetical protein